VTPFTVGRHHLLSAGVRSRRREIRRSRAQNIAAARVISVPDDFDSRRVCALETESVELKSGAHATEDIEHCRGLSALA
jgi:hypothetical protein